MPGVCPAEDCIYWHRGEYHERRRKEAGSLGGGRSQTAGDPVGAYGKQKTMKNRLLCRRFLCIGY